MEAIRYPYPLSDGSLASVEDYEPPKLELAAPPSVALRGLDRVTVSVLHTKVFCVSGDDVLQALATRPRHARRLCYVNAHSLNLAYRDEPYSEVLASADFVLNDGIGLEIAARMRGKRFVENLNGSDFTIRVLELAASKGWRVYLYGGRPGVAARARDRLCGLIEGLEVVGVCDGYRPELVEEIVEQIRLSAADVLLVALGQPAQELWLDEHLADTGCHLGLGVGAFLDFASGTVVRAPRWVNRVGMEWLFRLVQEPARLCRRYIVGNPLFLWRAWRLRALEID
jgi:N-acetylglucosaminyldiphosphoundecaprenol N-acetyl-beta-D-mannosaminyltransferase